MDIIPKKATGKPGGQIPLAVAGKSGERVKNDIDCTINTYLTVSKKKLGTAENCGFSGWDFDLLHSFVREQTHRPLLASHKPLLASHKPLLASHKPLPAKTASYPQAGAQNYAINQMPQSGAQNYAINQMPQAGAQNYAINQMAQRTACRTCAVVPNRATGSAQEQGLALPVAPHWLLRPQEPSGGLIAGNWAAVAVDVTTELHAHCRSRPECPARCVRRARRRRCVVYRRWPSAAAG